MTTPEFRIPFIGLTGGLGSGKSTALALLGELGCATTSADAIVHALYAGDELRGQVVERWGEGVLAEDGSVDRAAIARHAFASDEERRWLESVVWPLVGAATWQFRLDAEAAAAGGDRGRDTGGAGADRVVPMSGAGSGGDPGDDGVAGTAGAGSAAAERDGAPGSSSAVTSRAASIPPAPRAAVVETPLLFEAGLDAAYDATIAVTAPEAVRAARAAARGHEAVDERAKAQLSQAEKAERADVHVVNDGDLEQLRSRLAAALDELAPPPVAGR